MRVFAGTAMLLLSGLCAPFFEVSAVNIAIDIDVEDRVMLGDRIEFKYILTSDSAVTIEYVVGIDCPAYPLPPLELLTGEIVPGIAIEDTFSLGTVMDSTEPQTCEARVTILDPIEDEVAREFSIETADPVVVSLKTCRDVGCSDPARVFYTGDTVYVSFEYNGEGGDGDLDIVGARIEAPGGGREDLSLPGVYQPGEVGTYTIYPDDISSPYVSSDSSYSFAVNVGPATLGVPSEDSSVGSVTPVDGEGERPVLQALSDSVGTDWRTIVAAVLTAVVLGGTVFIILKRREVQREENPEKNT